MASSGALHDSSQVWVPAPAFATVEGAPTLAGQATRWSVWLLDAAVTEGVASSVELPRSWSSAHVDLYWSNPAAGAGDVRWTLNLDRAAAAASLAVSAGGGTAAVTVTAAAQDVLTVSRLFTSQAVDSVQLLNLRLLRLGGAAADTLANDASVVGVLLTRAS